MNVTVLNPSERQSGDDCCQSRMDTKPPIVIGKIIVPGQSTGSNARVVHVTAIAIITHGQALIPPEMTKIKQKI